MSPFSFKPLPFAALAGGLGFALASVAVIAATAGSLSHFEVVGPTRPFQYPWRLTEPTDWSRASAWVGYALHNLSVWGIIAYAQRVKLGFSDRFRGANWAMVGVHVVFVGLHILQTQIWYDGLAQDVPEVTALGSVALMLMVILLMESPRRGLFWGRKVRFSKRLLIVCKRYHGYLFSWALIYTFWYHPAVATPGHLWGFFYLLLLLWQSTLLFHRAHLDRRWTLLLEILVIPHAVLVAIAQGKGLWAMFGFGFGSVFILTQMHGLGWSPRLRRGIGLLFVVSMVVAYSLTDRLGQIHEVTRIPVLDYLVVYLLVGLFWLIDRLRPPGNLGQTSEPEALES
jgi:uncharacterized membrane protein YhdT